MSNNKTRNGFLALVLEPQSQDAVLGHCAHENAHGDYVTLYFRPTEEVLEAYRGQLGVYREIKVIGELKGRKVQTLLVESPFPELPMNRDPYVTVSLVRGVARKTSNEIIERHKRKKVQLRPPPVAKLVGRLQFIEFGSR